MLDCAAAEKVLQRAVVGAPVDSVELEEALAHVAGCARCGGRFDVGAVRTYLMGSDEVSDVAEPVEPIALFERAMTAALSDPEAIVRMRAAERMGEFERLGPVALDALAETAADDADEEVREAALVALDRLDTEVSLPQRLIESWSETPAEAAPYLADCLRRLAAWSATPAEAAPSRAHMLAPLTIGRRPPSAPVTQLVTSPTEAAEQLAISGEEGITGRLGREKEELWLRLGQLPPSLEQAKPVVAVPNALEKDAPPVRWSGESPGLVPAQAPVALGSLDVLLGNALEPPETPVSETLFGQVYLLNPREQSGGV